MVAKFENNLNIGNMSIISFSILSRQRWQNILMMSTILLLSTFSSPSARSFRVNRSPVQTMTRLMMVIGDDIRALFKITTMITMVNPPDPQ